MHSYCISCNATHNNQTNETNKRECTSNEYETKCLVAARRQRQQHPRLCASEHSVSFSEYMRMCWCMNQFAILYIFSRLYEEWAIRKCKRVQERKRSNENGECKRLHLMCALCACLSSSSSSSSSVVYRKQDGIIENHIYWWFIEPTYMNTEFFCIKICSSNKK